MGGSPPPSAMVPEALTGEHAAVEINFVSRRTGQIRFFDRGPERAFASRRHAAASARMKVDFVRDAVNRDDLGMGGNGQKQRKGQYDQGRCRNPASSARPCFANLRPPTVACGGLLIKLRDRGQDTN